MIPPISSLPGLPPPTAAAGSTGPAAGASGAQSGGGGVASAIGNVFDSLANVQNAASADEAATAAGQGSLTDTMIAATEASLQTEVTTSVLDKALDAYNSVVQMTF